MNRREFVGTSIAALAASSFRADEPVSETLYNGIKLPSPWPPKWKDLPKLPLTPHYLVSPPEVIPIDVGRQLFVDDFLIEKTTLTRTFHQARPYTGNPVVRPDQPWEREGGRAMAMVFSDGVWYDPSDKLFKMWYMGGYVRSVCLAVSEDGLKWKKPDWGVRKGTNIVLFGPRDSTTVWLDQDATDRKKRFVLWRSHRDGKQFGQSLHFSEDGIHWSDRVLRTSETGDRTTEFYNPFRKKWIYSIRSGPGELRNRRYWETSDLVKGPMWDKIEEASRWYAADQLDPQREDLKTVPELYNLDAVAYESLMLGLFSIWRGDKNFPSGRPKPNDICTGFSRDGFHWRRPDRRAFIGVSEKAGDWNWGNVQSAGGCCLVVGDELWFYHSGRAGAPGDKNTRDGGGSTGLAILRRDGFASMDAGEVGGTLTTRPVRFAGKYLFVNADAKDGELTIEVLGEQGKPLAGLSAAECVPVRDNMSKQAVTWKKGDLATIAGRTVKFRFHLKKAQLFAFWVSQTAAGASTGYVAAGGPGLTNRDL